MGMFADLYEGPEPWDDDEDVYKPRYRGKDWGIVCRNCGAKSLWWLPKRRGEYRLMNPDGSTHECRPVATASDFDA